MSSLQSYPVVTTFDQERKVLRAKWNIKDYKKIKTAFVLSDVFAHSSAIPEWKLKIYPNGYNDTSANNLSFYLCEMKKCDAIVSFSLGYVDKNGTSFLKDPFNHAYDQSIAGFGYAMIVTTDFVKASLIKDDGSVTLLAKIEYATLKWGPKTRFSRLKVGNDLGLALGGDYTDIIFLVGTLSIKAHKVIIAYRSRYFKAMFDRDSREARSDVINITDFEFAVIRGLLEFIYVGTIALTNIAFASSLRIAADKYEVFDLREICEDYVARVDKKTAAKAIVSTSLVVSDRIRRACLEIFKKRDNYEDIDNFDDVFENSIIRKYVIGETL